MLHFVYEMKMSDDDIAEIRARHEQVPSGNLSIAAISLAHADRATLLAEVERLRAEIAKLEGESKAPGVKS